MSKLSQCTSNQKEQFYMNRIQSERGSNKDLAKNKSVMPNKYHKKLPNKLKYGYK